MARRRLQPTKITTIKRFSGGGPFDEGYNPGDTGYRAPRATAPGSGATQRSLQPTGPVKLSTPQPSGVGGRTPMAPGSRRGTVNPVGITRGTGNGRKAAPGRMASEHQVAAGSLAKTQRKRKVGG